jgi:hypothetical protein
MASKKNTAKKADVPQVTCWDDVPDEPYDPCTTLGGQRLAAEVYYYTNCQTAADFAAWWEMNKQALTVSKSAGEADHEAGFKDGMHTASMVVDEVLHDLRVDLENADLDPTANTAVRMTLEMVSRLWYERKGAM